MKKLWGIRHMRYVYLVLKFILWWERCGKYMGMFPNHRDIEYLRDVWKGKQ